MLSILICSGRKAEVKSKTWCTCHITLNLYDIYCIKVYILTYESGLISFTQTSMMNLTEIKIKGTVCRL